MFPLNVTAFATLSVWVSVSASETISSVLPVICGRRGLAFVGFAWPTLLGQRYRLCQRQCGALALLTSRDLPAGVRARPIAAAGLLYCVRRPNPFCS